VTRRDLGGTKHSGYGREHAIETLQEFSYTKMVRFPSGLGTWRDSPSARTTADARSVAHTWAGGGGGHAPSTGGGGTTT
jgi:hypothetical protein